MRSYGGAVFLTSVFYTLHFYLQKISNTNFLATKFLRAFYKSSVSSDKIDTELSNFTRFFSFINRNSIFGETVLISVFVVYTLIQTLLMHFQPEPAQCNFCIFFGFNAEITAYFVMLSEVRVNFVIFFLQIPPETITPNISTAAFLNSLLVG